MRIGLVGFNTSHVVQFTMRFNHVDIEETIELVAFIEAAAKSAQNSGQVTPLFD